MANDRVEPLAAGMVNGDGAVVNKAIAGTVTTIVNFVPLESVTMTLLAPPAVPDMASILSVDPPTPLVAAVTSAGLALCAV